MGQKFSSLKRAAIALSELQHLDNDETKEEISFCMRLDEQTMVEMLERKLIFKEIQVKEAENCANAAFLLARLGILESENAIEAFYADTETHIVALETNISEVSDEYKELSADQDPEESKWVLKTFTDSKGATFCLKKKLEMALDAFNKLNVRLATLISELDIGGCSQPA
ncbi:unnamed protein product, partial [Prunus brigantina]